MAGTFVTFEGIDGCGKTTQLELLCAALAERGIRAVRLREPGGTAISEKIRALLLDPANMEMRPQAELLLYEASRAQLVTQVIKPALEVGAVVVCDRFFDSTFAYQSGARGLEEDIIRMANELGSCGCTPDATVVFDLDPTVAWERATHNGADRLEAEGLAFQERVRAGYHRAAELEPERLRMIDAARTREEVFSRLVEALSDVLPQLEGLDVAAFVARQADVERAMADIAQGLGEGA
ncbi:MAG: dTMP kinase [Coriobacteriales bacterium]|nr:dTMP kinase [Coriobacteriales bacterium]